MNRQNIIVALALLAIVYGGLDYFILSAKKTGDQKAQKIAAANNFMKQVSQMLSDDVLTHKEAILFQKAFAQWPESVFFNSVDALGPKTQSDEKIAEEQPAKEHFEFVFSGYIEVAGRKLAVVNGLEYEQGEFLKIGGYRLKRISPEHVIIGKAGADDIKVMYQDLDPFQHNRQDEKGSKQSLGSSKPLSDYTNTEQFLMLR